MQAALADARLAARAAEAMQSKESGEFDDLDAPTSRSAAAIITMQLAHKRRAAEQGFQLKQDLADLTAEANGLRDQIASHMTGLTKIAGKWKLAKIAVDKTDSKLAQLTAQQLMPHQVAAAAIEKDWMLEYNFAQRWMVTTELAEMSAEAQAELKTGTAQEHIQAWADHRRELMATVATAISARLGEHRDRLDGLFRTAVEAAPHGAPPERSVLLRGVPLVNKPKAKLAGWMAREFGSLGDVAATYLLPSVPGGFSSASGEDVSGFAIIVFKAGAERHVAEAVLAGKVELPGLTALGEAMKPLTVELLPRGLLICSPLADVPLLEAAADTVTPVVSGSGESPESLPAGVPFKAVRMVCVDTSMQTCRLRDKDKLVTLAIRLDDSGSGHHRMLVQAPPPHSTPQGTREACERRLAALLEECLVESGARRQIRARPDVNDTAVVQTSAAIFQIPCVASNCAADYATASSGAQLFMRAESSQITVQASGGGRKRAPTAEVIMVEAPEWAIAELYLQAARAGLPGPAVAGTILGTIAAEFELGGFLELTVVDDTFLLSQLTHRPMALLTEGGKWVSAEDKDGKPVLQAIGMDAVAPVAAVAPRGPRPARRVVVRQADAAARGVQAARLFGRMGGGSGGSGRGKTPQRSTSWTGRQGAV